ncbi:hypothetical protein B0H19DRAFT_1075813 [Mycena capillaripes]|nr:hypothetical protein B0H19DRAFT_1075813 [Mycena capillaripes]
MPFHPHFSFFDTLVQCLVSHLRPGRLDTKESIGRCFLPVSTPTLGSRRARRASVADRSKGTGGDVRFGRAPPTHDARFRESQPVQMPSSGFMPSGCKLLIFDAITREFGAGSWGLMGLMAAVGEGREAKSSTIFDGSDRGMMGGRVPPPPVGTQTGWASVNYSVIKLPTHSLVKHIRLHRYLAVFGGLYSFYLWLSPTMAENPLWAFSTGETPPAGSFLKCSGNYLLLRSSAG